MSLSTGIDRASRIARSVAVLLCPVIIWWALSVFHADARTGEALRLAGADFLSSEAIVPPPAVATWEARTLPHDWRTGAQRTRDGWYRVPFRIESPGDAGWAVYLPRLSMNAAVFVNGERIGDGGRIEEPMARNWNRPLLFRIPDHLLVPGENLLHVHLRADLAGTGFLGPIQIGPERALAPLYQRSYAVRMSGVWIFGIIRVVVALFTASIWMQRRSEPYFGWFALMLLAWVAADVNLMIVDIPLSILVWYWLWYVAIGWFAIFGVLCILDFIGDRRTPFARGLLVAGFLGSAVLTLLAVVRPGWMHLVASRGWLPFAGVAIVYAACRAAALLRRGEGVEREMLYIVGVTIVGCVLHDLLADTGLRTRDQGHFTPYASPVVVVGMGWLVLRRFVAALRGSEALVGSLEGHVQRKRAELEQTYEQIRAAERHRIVSEERQRIMRDMNDGLGGHLISMLARIQQGDVESRAIAAAVRSALDDLRLMIDSLQPLDGDLLPALGMLRTRLQSRFEAAAIRVDWRVTDIPPIPGLGPHKVLQVLRILQQAIANILQCASARVITVRTGTGVVREAGSLPAPCSTRPGTAPAALQARTRAACRGVFVEIADDGTNGSGPSFGRGTEAARQRASNIGAAVEIVGSPTGARFRLWIPLTDGGSS